LGIGHPDIGELGGMGVIKRDNMVFNDLPDAQNFIIDLIIYKLKDLIVNLESFRVRK
jgi:hypothetical protein